MKKRIVLITFSKDMFCKHCNKPAKMYWHDKQMLNGLSETFYRDMHKECCELVYNKPVKTLQQLNEERKKNNDNLKKKK